MKVGLSVVFVVSVVLSCVPTEPQSNGEQPRPESIQLGAASEWQVKGGAAREEAVRAWTSMPSTGGALQLSRSYFPELAPIAPNGGRVPDDASLLEVAAPQRSDAPFELRTRGMLFKVTRLDAVPLEASRSDSVTHFGARRLWAPAGLSAQRGGAVLTSRFEEYEVVDGGGVHRAKYRIDLPSNIDAVRHAGEYLEFRDRSTASPVLRLHHAQVRDANGKARSGSMRLFGAALHEDSNLYAVAGTLEVELEVDLGGMAGPLVVDPGFSSTGSMATTRANHSLTLLNNGKVLAAGGTSLDNVTYYSSAEIYDALTGTWTGTGALPGLRAHHTATLLPSGLVLVVGGGAGAGGYPTAAVLFNPATGTWSTGGSLGTARTLHTATLLPNGKVLVVGGQNLAGTKLDTTELFTPGPNTFQPGPSTQDRRYSHSATMLPSGKLMVVGGIASIAEFYDPVTNLWSQGPAPILFSRREHSAVMLHSGKVLIVGGSSGGDPPTRTVELYDPVSNTFSNVAQAISGSTQSATLLPSGKVLVMVSTTAQLYNPATDTWTAAPAPSIYRYPNSSVVLPTGKVLFAGYAAYDEVYDPGDGTSVAGPRLLPYGRGEHTLTLLGSGKVLMAGGQYFSMYYATAQLFDPATAAWTDLPSMNNSRRGATATLLRSGKVLVAGGDSAGIQLANAELFDPVTNSWSVTAAMPAPRFNHAAILLSDGRVLVAGGFANSAYVAPAIIYNPTTGTWSTVGSLNGPREYANMARLPNGRVLLTGGFNGGTFLNTAELFDPATGNWTLTANMNETHFRHATVLLPNNKVMVVGGTSNVGPEAELFDPATGTWTATLPTATRRREVSASVLPWGEVILAGGWNPSNIQQSTTEAFDVASGKWTNSINMSRQRASQLVVPLPSGVLFMAGGNLNDSTEFFDKVGAPTSVRPRLTGPAMLPPGTSVTLRGTNLRGVSGASTGATNDAAANIPVVVLQSAMTGSLTALTVTSFSDTAITVSVPAGLVPERYLAWVIVAGVPAGRMVRVDAANTAPSASASSVAVTEDVAKPFALGATDSEDDPLIFTVLTNPQYGTLTGTPPNLTYTPNANYSGSDSFIYKANDGTADSPVTSLTLNVGPVNDPPTVAAPSAITVLEDAPLQTVSLSGITPGGGSDELGQSVTVTATSSNTALIPNPSVTGVGSTRSLSFTPAANANGSAQITVTATDNGGTANGGGNTTSVTFTVTVTPVNDAPALSPVANASALEDSSAQTVQLTGVAPGGGADESAQVVTVTATSSNPLLIPDPAVTGSGAARTLTYSPVANATGTATITVTATDDGGTANGGVAVFSRTFQITITGVNDAPSFAAISDASVSEDVPAALSITAVTAGGGADEASQNLVFTATSDNTAVVPNPGISGSGSTRSLTVTPAANAIGTATITVTLTDDGGTANGGGDTFSRTFTVTVNGSNDAPVFDVIPAANIAEDSSSQIVSVTGVSPGGGADEAAQTVVVTATSSDPSLVANGVVSGSGATRTLSFTPSANANGQVTITVTATDDGGTANGGVAVFSRTFILNVSPVNDAPTFGVIADQSVAEDSGAATVTLTAVGPGGGASESAQSVSLSAQSSDPTIVSQVSISGSGATRTLSLTPVSNAVGSVVITVTAIDDGGGANGGVDQFSRTFTVSVTAVNDPPVFDLVAPVTILEDAPGTVTLTGIAPGGGSDEATQTTTMTVTSSNPALLPNPTVTGTGATRTVSLSPAPNANGTFTLTVTLQDSGGLSNNGADTATRSVQVTITPVNDQPTFDALADQSVPRNSTAQTLQLTGVSAGGGADEEIQSVTLTATSSNPAVVTDVSVSGSGAVRQLSFAPVAGARGPVTLTLVATDSGGTANGALDSFSRTVTVTVTDTNTAPSAVAQSVAVDGRATPLTLAGTDAEGSALVFTVVSLPEHGTLTGDAPALVYTPDPGFDGADVFTFRVSDGELDSELATVDLSVTARLQSYYGWGCALGGGDVSLLSLLLMGMGLGLRRRLRGRGPFAALMLLVLGVGAAANAAEPAKKTDKRLKLAFIGVSAGQGVSSDAAASVSGYMQSELIALGAYEVIGSSDIQTMIGIERQKQLLGCSEDTESCMAEIAGALDSERALSGDVSQVGEEVVLNISLVDLKSSKSLSRVGRRLRGKVSDSQMLDEGRPALLELLASDPALAGRTLNVPSRFGGLVVGLRGEADVAGRSVAPSVMAELSSKRFGGALAVLIGSMPGFRGEGRYYPLEIGPVRPYVAGGATVFVPAVGLRGAVGASLRLGQFQVFGDVAYERFINRGPGFNANAVLAALGVGWQF